MFPLVYDPAFVQHHDSVRPGNRRGLVGNKTRYSALPEMVQSFEHSRCRGPVQSAGPFVKNENLRPLQKRASQRDPLLLTPGKLPSHRPQGLLETAWKLSNHVVELGQRHSLFEISAG